MITYDVFLQPLNFYFLCAVPSILVSWSMSTSASSGITHNAAGITNYQLPVFALIRKWKRGIDLMLLMAHWASASKIQSTALKCFS